MRSEHPPCTNWSGEGPGGGPVLPEPSLPLSIFWTDNYEMLQMPYGMRPGQEIRRSFYLEVFHEHQLRFGEWDIDCRFAAGSGAAGESGGTAQRGRGLRAPSPAASFELPPEIEADRYLRQAEQAVRDGNAESARTAMERLEALQQEHGLEPEPEDHYRYAVAWEAAGERQRAMAAAARYLRLGGRDAEHYTEALDLMNRAEFGKVGPAAGPAQGEMPAQPFQPGAGEPSCEGQEKGTFCWRELTSHPSCYVLTFSDYEPVTWTGGCSNGLASGAGTLKLFEGSEESEHIMYTGLVQNSKPHGDFVVRTAGGEVYEGPFVDGKKNGKWVERLADGDVGEGPYVNGKLDGRWVWRKPSGSTETVTYVNGVKQ